MRCSKCGAENPDRAKFCGECASPFTRRCSSCGTENSLTAKFCIECGKPLESKSQSAADVKSPIQAGAEAPDASIEGERKTVTILFADIKSSMELIEDLDPEEARAIVDPALKLMMEAVQRYGGYVAQSTGDGIFALFGAPVAHEDHPQRALYAAVRMQEELKRYSGRVCTERRLPIQARVGVNTGEVVVRSITTGEGRTEYVPVGHSTGIAARMQALAPVGSVAATEPVRKQCEGYFLFRSLGPTKVKGVSEPVAVYEVTGPGPLRTRLQRSAARGYTRFVGREQEMEALGHAAEQARSGRGQIVAVVAEPGVGKSRLFDEFRAGVPAECKLLEAYSLSHGKSSAWLAVLELLGSYFSIGDADDAATRREKVCASLTALDAALRDALPYLWSLLGIVDGEDPLAKMDPQIKRQRTLDAITRIFLGEAIKQPLVVIFEDLHWIDDHTQALLDSLADSIVNARVLLLVSYRPEYHHNWGNKSCYSQLHLGALSRESSQEMLDALLPTSIVLPSAEAGKAKGALSGDGAEVASLKRLVIERTGGNPFFIEETVQALVEDGTLVRNAAVKVTRSIPALRLPPTVQGILASRIDRLSVIHKDLLQTLAVIGQAAPLRVLRQVVGVQTQLEQALRVLRAAEFVYEQPNAVDVEYVFKHALTREVAYGSLLIERRKQIHERAGQALESIFADRLDDHFSQLAHHYSHSDNADKAIEYLVRAGQQALGRSAYDQAIRHLNSAVERLRTLPDRPERKMRELSLQMMVWPALIAFTGWGTVEVERTFARARELCTALGDPPELFGVSYLAWSLPWARAEMRAAKDAAMLLLGRAEEMHDPAALRMAHGAMGMTLFHMGEGKLAAEHCRTALSLGYPDQPQPQMGVDLKVVHLGYLGWALIQGGYPEQALQSALEAVARSRTLSHPHTTVYANAFIAAVRLERRELDQVLEVGEQLFAMCSEYGLADFLAEANSFRGVALASRGHEEGIPLIEQVVASRRKTGLKMVRPEELCSLAGACIAFNLFDKASEALNEALAIAESDGARYFEAETHRLRGELLLRKSESNRVEAEAYFERATEIARQQSARWWELRAMTSLARLLRDTGRRKQARKQLAEIYNWFTEGFDTADLKDASALLDELGRIS